MKIITRVLSAVMLLAVNSMLVSSYAASPNVASALGMNTNEAMDIDASVPFVDLFKLSLPFEHARPWLTKGKITYDNNGWPKNLHGGQAGTRFISNLPANTIPTGLYTVLYDGEGKLRYGVDAKLVKHSKGRDIIRIKPGKNGRISASVIIMETNPKNHIRHLQILMPGGICAGNKFRRVPSKHHCKTKKYLSFERYHKHITFNPDYLNFMKDFKVIRFMNMSGITRNGLMRWQNRPNTSQSTWGGKEGVRGVPLEVMVELANILNANPWFNLPHRADNSFVYNYAKYVKEHLKTGLKPYVEYTNEAWNGIFTQAHYMKKMGLKARLDRHKDVAGYKFYSRRSVEIFKIWEDVYGSTKNIIRVMGAMTTNKRLSNTLLGFENAYKYVDALAVAPYFYIDQKTIRKVRSVNEIFQRLKDPKNRYSVPSILKTVRMQAKVAKKYGVSLIAYEGGQHLVAYKTHSVNEGPNRHLIFANKDRRMAALYFSFLKGWKDAGGETFVAFSSPRINTWLGSWGIKEYITQPSKEAPKYQALMAFNRMSPCWWAGCRTGSKSSQGVVSADVVKSKPGIVLAGRVRPIPAARPLPVAYPLPAADPLMSIRLPGRSVRPAPRPVVVAAVMPRKPVLPKRSAVWQTYTPPAPAPAPRQAYRPQIVKVSTTKRRVVVRPSRLTGNEQPIGRVRNPQRIFSPQSEMRLMKAISGRIQDSNDLAAAWQAHWDAKSLHLRVDVTDDYFIKDSQQPWGDDSIEIFIDADGSRTASYDGKNDFQFMFRWKDYGIGLGKNSPRKNITGVRHKMIKTHDGYVLEASIPWSILGVRPRTGQSIGIDIQVNDDDDGGHRDGKLAWNATQDKAWKSPQHFGRLVLVN
ncbi:MAG: hypothetical protein KAH22_07900 [Thiotrichaceae bacterium]|nr:hypothetical protein [Thiotrichaceae bacterium]